VSGSPITTLSETLGVRENASLRIGGVVIAVRYRKRFQVIFDSRAKRRLSFGVWENGELNKIGWRGQVIRNGIEMIILCTRSQSVAVSAYWKFILGGGEESVGSVCVCATVRATVRDVQGIILLSD
jgi:hypothetical protein